MKIQCVKSIIKGYSNEIYGEIIGNLSDEIFLT